MANPEEQKRLAEIRERAEKATPDERWLTVPGYEGLYEVSDLGRVRSYLKPGNHSDKKDPRPRVMKTGRNKGRATVALSRDGKYVTKRVATLVLEAFDRKRPKGMECAHEDGDCTNDRLANLSWKTHSDNEADKIRHGTNPIGERNGASKLLSWQVAEIRYLLDKGVPQAKLCALFDVSRDCVSSIATDKRWGDFRHDIPYLLDLVERLTSQRSGEDARLRSAKDKGFTVGSLAALDLVHGLFSDSMHENWNKYEITDAIEALRKGLDLKEDGNGK